MVLQYRSETRLVSNVFSAFLNERDESGRFHPGFMQNGTETGRLSAARVHQLDRLDNEKTMAGIE